LSENVPVAANCWVVPLGVLAGEGLTAMDSSTAGATVRVVVPATPP